MLFRASTILLIFVINGLNSIRIRWGNYSEAYKNGINGIRRDMPVPRWFKIFPGTKWCGAGNVTDNETDLGFFADTDECCRIHDFCDDYIEGYQTKHNLENPHFYTRLNCKCDEEFHKCLKTVDSIISKHVVGHAYFKALGTQCFKKEHPIVKCLKYERIFILKTICVEYEYDTSKEKVYQWFDVPSL